MKYVGITSPMFSMQGKTKQGTQLSCNIDIDFNKYNHIKSENYKHKNYPKFSFGKQKKFCDLSTQKVSKKLPKQNKNVTKKNIRINQTFSKSTRQFITDQNEHTPGPGDYQNFYNKPKIKNKNLNLQSRSYSLPYLQEKQNQVGFYDLKNHNWEQGTKIYHKPTEKQVQKKETFLQPQIKLTLSNCKKKQNGSFSQAIRQLQQGQNTPGPGEYNVGKSYLFTKKNSQGQVFSKSQSKEKLFKTQSIIETQIINPKITEKKHKGYSFSKYNRFRDTQIANQSQVNLNPKKSQFFNYKFSFGQQVKKKENNKENTPGPGTYNLKTFFKKKNQKIIPENILNRRKKITPTPGPNQYYPRKDQMYRQQHGCKFGTETRQQKTHGISDLPYYDKHKDLYKGQKFSLNKRFKEDINKENQEHYNIESTICQLPYWLKKKYQNE